MALQQTVPGAVNPVRPYQSYGAITYRETTARSNYHGLLTSTKIEAGRSGSVTLNYTLSRNQTDATNDRDAIDIPQNPANPDADYADARTDRRHIFNGSFTYELPFFRDGNALRQGGARRLAGRRHRQHLLGPADAAHPGAERHVPARRLRRPGRRSEWSASASSTACPYWFNPDAFAPPAAGTFGNSGRAPFRQPGRHQWDLNFSKNFYPTSTMRLQFRAELINAFDQRQWLADPLSNGLDNTCTFSNTACNVAGDRFGQIIATRAAARDPARA